MRITGKSLGIAILLLIMTAGVSMAQNGKAVGRTYQVTITNLTKNQIFSPPVIASHNSDFRLFELGEPASMEVRYVAEDAINAPLLSILGTDPAVFDYVSGNAPILPGKSATYELSARGNYRLVSLIGMLVTTNDAFFALNGVQVSPGKPAMLQSPAYDAGTEENSESCAYIPGPPCGSGGARDIDGAEGYVYVHSGIHGIGDLAPYEFDWLNPVAKISIGN